MLNQGKLCGIISERDYARKIALMGRTSPGTQVKDIMATRVLCVRSEQTVHECMALMTAKAVRHLPVLENKTVVGPNCGTTMWWEAEQRPELIGIPAGTFADTSLPPPGFSSFERHRHAWTAHAGGLALMHHE